MTNIPSKRVTAQMIFDAAWQAFIVERRPPAQESDEYGQWACRYLTKDGRKCAVGLCIPDGHPYQQSTLSFNGLIGDDMHAEDPLFAEEFYVNDRLRETIQGYLHDMNVHDGSWSQPLETIEKIYRNFAREHKLTIPGEDPNAAGME